MLPGGDHPGLVTHRPLEVHDIGPMDPHKPLRIELVFRTEEGDLFELRDSSTDFEGHAHDPKLEDGAVFPYLGRMWLVRRDADRADRFICTPVES